MYYAIRMKPEFVNLFISCNFVERGLWNKNRIWVESKENEDEFVNINKRGLWENKEDAMKYVIGQKAVISVKMLTPPDPNSWGPGPAAQRFPK
jgi:hypothetical protein